MLLAQIKSNYSSGGDSSSDDEDEEAEEKKSSRKTKKEDKSDEKDEGAAHAATRRQLVLLRRASSPLKTNLFLPFFFQTMKTLKAPVRTATSRSAASATSCSVTNSR